MKRSPTFSAWLDNSNTDDVFLYQEAFEDSKNSLYTIVDSVDIDITTDDSGSRYYSLPQKEVDRKERLLQGGDDLDIELE